MQARHKKGEPEGSPLVLQFLGLELVLQPQIDYTSTIA
jgi:hypothetical protein